jgi:hypothetical protein
VKRLFALGVFAWLAVTPATWAQQDLTREQVLAYVALTKADRARDRGEALPALAAYEEALTKYSAIKQRDPRWHPDVVQYRIQYCLQELDKLKTAKTPAAPPPAAAAPAVTPTPDAPPAAAPALDQDVQALRAQVAELQAALAVTQRLVQVEQEYATVARSGISCAPVWRSWRRPHGRLIAARNCGRPSSSTSRSGIVCRRSWKVYASRWRR